MAKPSELSLRVFAAAVFGPILLALFWFGGIPLIVGLCLMLGGGTWEFYRIEKQKGLRPWTWLGIAASLIWCLAILRYQSGTLFVVLGMLFVVCFAPILVKRLETFRVRHAFSTLKGFLYVGFLGSFAYLVRNFPEFEGSEFGAALLSITILAGIWATDIAAYFLGRWFGKHRPFPTISPGKTEAGFVGGFLAGAAVVMAGSLVFDVIPFGVSFGLAAVVGFGSQVGDLFESMIKREAGIKDSSRLIPGHGGILDRFDGFLFVFPLAYLYLSLLPKLTP